MASKEIIFEGMPGFPTSGKELHFTLGVDNRVEWQTIPLGEQGRSRQFEDLAEAERFIRGYAARLNFTARPEDGSSDLTKLPT